MIVMICLILVKNYYQRSNSTERYNCSDPQLYYWYPKRQHQILHAIWHKWWDRVLRRYFHLVPSNPHITTESAQKQGREIRPDHTPNFPTILHRNEASWYDAWVCSLFGTTVRICGTCNCDTPSHCIHPHKHRHPIWSQKHSRITAISAISPVVCYKVCRWNCFTRSDKYSS